jgi:hypothetical protein
MDNPWLTPYVPQNTQCEDAIAIGQEDLVLRFDDPSSVRFQK